MACSACAAASAGSSLATLSRNLVSQLGKRQRPFRAAAVSQDRGLQVRPSLVRTCSTAGNW